MNTYGWVLLGQTLLALLGLGLCGGWVVRPFRRPERPYLWLTAPLAGLFALGGALALLYYGARLPFQWCLGLSLALNAAATVACLVRGRPALPSLGNRTLATVLVLGAAYWATVSCNKTAIDAREPTIAALEGSDMFGYALTADWLRAHDASRPPRMDEPFEVLMHVNLFLDGGRPLSFLLTAAAGEVRSTSSLFSYDWAAGVILAAAMLGFGGAFAPNSLALVLLVAGGGTSNWLANSRTGYMAKSIAYPGAVLLAGLFLTTAKDFTWRRFATLAALGFGVAFSLAPVFLAAALGMVAGCYLASLAAVFVLNRWRDPATSLRAGLGMPGLAAVLASAGAVVPAFVFYYAPRHGIGVPGVPPQWSLVIPVSLDLEPPAIPLLKPQTEKRLLYACVALLLVSTVAALRSRQPAALALVGCAAIIPVSWLLRTPLLHTFHGVIYPLTLAGAGLLLAVPPALSWRYARFGLAAVLAVGMVGARVPQIRATADRYVYSVQPYRTVVRQSDAEAIRAVAGTDAIDVPLGFYGDNHVVLSELLARGTTIRLRPPAWDRSLRNWARVAGCPEPDLVAPKSRFTLMEKNAYAPPGSERWVGSRLKLVEDRDAVTVLGVADTQEMSWDTQWRPGVWIGNTPTTFLIHNGTGTPQSIRLCGITSPGPARPDRDRTLVWRLGGQGGKLTALVESKAAISLRLAPGLNKVELSVEEPADPPPKPLHPVLLLNFRDWSLEPPDPAAPRSAGW
jgi:hypothetical protein